MEAGCFLLVHAMVGATYYNRGMYTGLLWGYAGAARLAAELACVKLLRGNAPVPADVPDRLSRLRTRRSSTSALRPLAAGWRAWEFGTRRNRRSQRRTATSSSAPAPVWIVDYPARLDRAVSDYLLREGVFVDDTD